MSAPQQQAFATELTPEMTQPTDVIVSEPVDFATELTPEMTQPADVRPAEEKKHSLPSVAARQLVAQYTLELQSLEHQMKAERDAIQKKYDRLCDPINRQLQQLKREHHVKGMISFYASPLLRPRRLLPTGQEDPSDLAERNFPRNLWKWDFDTFQRGVHYVEAQGFRCYQYDPRREHDGSQPSIMTLHEGHTFINTVNTLVSLICEREMVGAFLIVKVNNDGSVCDLTTRSDPALQAIYETPKSTMSTFVVNRAPAAGAVTTVLRYSNRAMPKRRICNDRPAGAYDDDDYPSDDDRYIQ